MPQLEYIFFKPGTDGPSPEERLAWLEPSNPKSPYYGFIGNRKAIDKLIRMDFEALGNHNHVCRELAVAFLGQPSTGKTELARRHAKANGLPTVEFSPKSLKTTHDLFEGVRDVCLKHGLPLVQLGEPDNYILPPVNIFIDEVHALSPAVVQGLLKATEYKDSILVTEKKVTVNCTNVHWMIATTDRGRLFDAFDTRFMKVILNLYKKDEIAEIVQMNYPDWTLDTCKLVAHYCGRVPREALAFAREMRLEKGMRPKASWAEAAAKVAFDSEIDEFGMTFKRLAILKALGQGPVAEKRLPIIANVKPEELDKFIMPWLLANTEDEQAFVTVSTKGYTITEAGLEELEKRGLDHNGEEALAA